MNPDTKYYISTLIFFPAVAVPSILGGLLLGGYLATFVEGGRLVIPLITVCVLMKGTSALTGIVLEKLGLLPRFSWRHYPNATSWGGYLKKTGAL